MSDINFSCPKCRMAIVCDDSYIRSTINCPGCQMKMEVPDLTSSPTAGANHKVTGPPVRDTRKRNGTRHELSDVNLKPPVVAAAILGLLPTLALPLMIDLPDGLSVFWTLTAVFLFFFGGALGLITGFMYLVRAFRISIWWGWTLLVPVFCTILGEMVEGTMSAVLGMVSILSFLAGLVFLVMHWSKIWKLWLTNLGASAVMFASLFVFGFGLMNSLGINFADGFEGQAFSEFTTSSANEDPYAAYYGFSQAMVEENYPVAFAHLTPESQATMIAAPVLAVALEQAFSGKPGTKGPNMLKVESVFAKRGVSLKPQEISESSFDNIPDKGLLFAELVEAVPSLFSDLADELPAGGLVEVTLVGDTATGVVDGEEIHFKQINGSWLVDLAAMDDDELTIELGDMDFQNAYMRTSKSKRAKPQELQGNVLQFHTDKAHAGNRTSQYELGMHHLRGGSEEDLEQAKHWLTLSSEQGYSRAEKELNALTRRMESQAASEARIAQNLTRLSSEKAE